LYRALSTCDGARFQLSHQLKLTLFVLAFNVVGFAEGYLLRDLGLVWLVPILILTALGAVLASRRVL
jgi:hypothetical protein